MNVRQGNMDVSIIVKILKVLTSAFVDQDMRFILTENPVLVSSE